jgi:HlyD family secretion protein
VAARVAGRIDNVTADYGAKVRAGEVLAQLDAAPYEAEVERGKANFERAQAKFALAKARMELARRQFERLSKLRDGKAVDESAVETAKAELEIAEATLRLEEAGIAESRAAMRRAELDLSYCTLRAPVDGVVLDRRCAVGQVVAAAGGPRLFVIARDLKRVRVLAAVKEADIPRVALGQRARLTVEAFPKETFQGAVAQIRLNAAARGGSVTYTVVIQIDNPDEKLLPSMTAQVTIAVGERR